MIPEQQREVILDNYVREILNGDRSDKNYVCIEKLWEASGLTNKDLVNELLSDSENAAEDFKESIFWDMIFLLKDKIMESSALRNLFSDLYAKRYPKVDKYVKDFEEKVTIGQKITIGFLDFDTFYKKNSLDETLYFLFRMYNSDIFVMNDCIDNDFWKTDYRKANNFFSDREAEEKEASMRFTDGEKDQIFSSKRYERFVMKQKQALADYLHIKVDELADIYDKVMTIQEGVEEYSIGFHSSGFGVAASAIIEIIWLHGGTAQWLVNIQSLNRKNKLGYRYRPDFDKLFEKYCRASVSMAYSSCIGNGEEFTSMMLAKDCSFTNMEALAESLAYMYMCDSLYQMYVQMQKQYYENFSWEKYRNRDMRERYESVIRDLKSSLASKDSQLLNLQGLYHSLKASLEKKNDEALVQELQEKEKLLRISDEKDAEIERLKAIIASQNQLIEQLQVLPTNGTVDDDVSRFDKDADNIIYQHKYLFVGDITSLGFEDLRRRFPSSIFMNTNTANLSQIQVDAVVYLIQAMGHSMYYKCKTSSELKDAKVIYFNGRGNLTSLLETIEREMQS